MNAKTITIASKRHEQDLRRRVHGGLLLDTSDPDVAYACGVCGNILSFDAAGMTRSGTTVSCPKCGEVNTVQSAAPATDGHRVYADGFRS